VELCDCRLTVMGGVYLCIFFAGLLTVFLQPGTSKGFWNIEKHVGDIVQKTKPTKEQTFSSQQEETTNLSPRIKAEEGMRVALPNVSKVLVETNKQEYSQDEEIVVTITNDLDTNITTFDQQAFCTMIRLEQQSGTEWREVRNCFSGVPSKLVTLKPYTKTSVKLPALSPSIYRTLIIFSLGETFNFGKSFTASSLPFSVR
jgi:hypothetical protein